ncbi:hypothetical protein FF38_09005 [Lucilia cuprina]|uniref:Uncharacterized protein n=1 Tax=Lucilia cuprina TaxID=7375 RepID=A0A0L0CNE8_LUCCU|nr:hypothetical protein FF38_09005 [Lucilia cuprina]
MQDIMGHIGRRLTVNCRRGRCIVEVEVVAKITDNPFYCDSIRPIWSETNEISAELRQHDDTCCQGVNNTIAMRNPVSLYPNLGDVRMSRYIIERLPAFMDMFLVYLYSPIYHSHIVDDKDLGVLQSEGREVLPIPLDGRDYKLGFTAWLSPFIN